MRQGAFTEITATLYSKSKWISTHILHHETALVAGILTINRHKILLENNQCSPFVVSIPFSFPLSAGIPYRSWSCPYQRPSSNLGCLPGWGSGWLCPHSVRQVGAHSTRYHGTQTPHRRLSSGREQRTTEELIAIYRDRRRRDEIVVGLWFIGHKFVATLSAGRRGRPELPGGGREVAGPPYDCRKSDG